MRLLMVLMICAAGLLSAQDVANNVYRLEVAIHEVENDKRADTRNYTLLMKSGSKATSRTGSRVPISVGGEGSQSVQYVDIAANLDFTLQEAGDNVRLDAELELSDADKTPAGATTSKSPWRRSRGSSESLIPFSLPCALPGESNHRSKGGRNNEIENLRNRDAIPGHGRAGRLRAEGQNGLRPVHRLYRLPHLCLEEL